MHTTIITTCYNATRQSNPPSRAIDGFEGPHSAMESCGPARARAPPARTHALRTPAVARLLLMCVCIVCPAQIVGLDESWSRPSGIPLFGGLTPFLPVRHVTSAVMACPGCCPALPARRPRCTRAMCGAAEEARAAGPSARLTRAHPVARRRPRCEGGCTRTLSRKLRLSSSGRHAGGRAGRRKGWRS